MSIHWVRKGKGFPIVFFHGWGFDSAIWRPLLPQLENDYQLFLVDLPGFGASSAMNWFDFKAQLKKHLPSEVALVGWSLGGLFASRFAIEEPLCVRYLFNVTSSPYFLEDATWPGVSKAIFHQFYHHLVADSAKTLKHFVHWQAPTTEWPMIPDVLPSLVGLANGLEILNCWDLRGDLSLLKASTCYLFGRLDPITPVRLMQVMQTQYPHFQYLLFNQAAHMPFVSHPVEFIKQLRLLIR